jgi:hypothetical protein
MTTKDEQSLGHPIGRLVLMLPFDDDDAAGERQHAVIGGVPQRHRRRGQRSRRNPLAAHGATAINQQTPRGRRSMPVEGPQLIQPRCSTLTACLDDALDRRVDIEVATGLGQRFRHDAADATSPVRAMLRQFDHQLPGVLPRQCPKRRVGCTG